MADTNKTANTAKQGKTAPAKDNWFSLSGIQKEAKRVRWPHWKSQGANNPGVMENSTEVVFFTASFALFFVLCEFVVTYVLKFMGIGA